MQDAVLDEHVFAGRRDCDVVPSGFAYLLGCPVLRATVMAGAFTVISNEQNIGPFLRNQQSLLHFLHGLGWERHLLLFGPHEHIGSLQYCLEFVVSLSFLLLRFAEVPFGVSAAELRHGRAHHARWLFDLVLNFLQVV